MALSETVSVEEHVRRALAFCDSSLDVLHDGDIEAALVAVEAARTELIALLSESETG